MTWQKRAVLGALALVVFSTWTVQMGGEASLTSLEPYVTAVQEIVDLVNAGKTEEAFAVLDSLHSAVLTLRAELRGLRFAGLAPTLFDPVSLPAGTYRVHLMTSGVATAEIVEMDGQPVEFLFLLTRGYASTVYEATGAQVMVRVSICTEPYTLLFEKM